MGELLCPCLVQGSVGVVYPVRPQEEQPQWRGSSGNLDSAPAGTPSAGPGGSGAGPLICSARGRSVLAVLGPPGLCLSRGEAGSWAVSRRPVLRSLRWWIRAPGPRSPFRGAAAQAPPSCSWNRAAPSARSLFFCPSPSELLRVPPCALQPLGSSAHSPGRRCLLVSPGARGHPRPPGSCSTSPRAPFRPGRSVQLLLLRDGALLSWGHSPRPQPGSSRGPSPLEAFCFFISFSPSSYLDRSANSSHCSIPGVLSLNLRPNS